MLKITNLHAHIDEKSILKGINLEIKPGEVHAIMGPNGSGKSTLASVIAGKEEYEVEKGEITLEGQNIDELSVEERAHKGIFLSFQYPVEIPGVTVTNFIKTSLNEMRKAKGLDDMPAKEMLKLIREKSELLEIDRKFLSRSLNQGFSGGEKKRNEIFQMAMLEPKLAILDETDSREETIIVSVSSFTKLNDFKSRKSHFINVFLNLVCSHSETLINNMKLFTLFVNFYFNLRTAIFDTCLSYIGKMF